MTDWIHCNKCYLRPTSEESKFLLTSCGHILCSRCTAPGEKTVCPTCKSTSTTIVLSENMNPDILSYFTDFEETLQKVIKILQFQSNNRSKLLSHVTKQNKIMEAKYEHAKQYMKKMRQQYEALEKNYQRMKNCLMMSVNSPSLHSKQPGKGRPAFNGTGNQSNTPTFSGNPDRFITRGHPNGWNPNDSSFRSNASNQSSSFRTPSGFQIPSALSYASSATTKPKERPQGPPNGKRYPQPSPRDLNFSGLNIGFGKKNQ